MSLCVNIKKQLGDQLLDINFCTEEGVLGVFGPSGVGKSIMLKCIAGIETPDLGKIIYNDQVLFDSDRGINIPIRDRKIGYLFQNYALFPHMTVEQNISCAISGSDKGNTIIKLLDTFQLNESRTRYPKQLSGGQKQRVALARMMAANPQVILLDEPFSALDYELKQLLQEEVKDLIRPLDNTILFVSHDLEEIQEMCSKMMVIDNGKNTKPRQMGEVFKVPETLQEARLIKNRNIVEAIPQTSNTIHIPSWEYTLIMESDTSLCTHVVIDAHHMQLVDRDDTRGFRASGIKLKEKAFSYEITTSMPPILLEVDKTTWKKYGSIEAIYIMIESQDIMLINRR